MNTCALSQGQTAPRVHLKDLQDLQQGLWWPTLVILKCSVLKVCSRVVGRACLMSANTTTNSFEVHGVVGREHESGAPKCFTTI